MDSLTVGEWREGKVTSVVPFGAFVDIGGIDGLVHISQLGASGYVEKAEDVVQPGQTVRVRVVEVDRDRQRIGLSMREASAPRAPRPASAERPASSGTFGAGTGGASGTAPSGESGGAPSESGGQNRRPERPSRPRGGGEPFRNVGGDGKPRTSRRREAEESEEWRPVRGGAASEYYAIFDDDEENNEPAPTTAEELVARFNKGRR